MDLILDANILFAALIKDSFTAEIIFNENIHLFAPEFLFREFLKHKDEILRKTKRSSEDFNEIFRLLQQIITIMPKEEFYEYLNEAENFSPNPDDVQYFALALKLNISLWSNDDKLKKQDKVKIYSTEEIIKFI